MANYVWTPFASMSTGGLQLANNNIGGVQNLGTLGNNDVLYIFAHHNKFLPHISDGNIKMSVYELCDAIVAAGLSRAHTVIKLWVCYGGLGMKQKQGFGYQLWHTLKNIYGYTNLTLYAYTAITVDPIMDGHKYAMELDAKGKMYELEGTAKNYRVGIRANGQFIAPGMQ